MSWAVVGTVGASVASNVLSSKILGTDEQKAPIGTGQSAGIQAGPPLEIDPIEGSSVDEFGEFDTENFAESAQNEQDRLMELILMEQMKDDEGIASLYSGGYVKKAADGTLLGDIDLSMDLEIPEYEIDPELITPELYEEPEVASLIERIQDFYYRLDPEIQDELMKGAEKVGIATLQRLVSGKQPRPGGRVKTPEAGGFQNKREMQKIKPIQGSSFADGGAVLNRKMFAQNFMPDGGKIKGPGGPKDDLIPVMASNGEYMLSKAAVDQAGGGNHAKGVAALEAFNALGNMRYG
jgi:hypothetical protein